VTGEAGHRRPVYSDTAAIDDLHALITRPGGPGDDVVADITEILARTGRPAITGRDIEVTTTQTSLGWPVISITSGHTAVIVRQDPAGPGLRIEVTASTPAELDGLAITLDRPSPPHD